MFPLHLLAKRLTKQSPVIVCVILLATMFSLQLTTALQESQTIDEGVHLAAGLSYLRTGDFRMNPEHPPLVKMLAAVPLLFTQSKLPLDSKYWREWRQWEFGDIFLHQNTRPAQTLLLLGRIPIMLVSVFLGVMIFLASRQLFGPWPAVFSVGLYALDPGFIAHGHYITTDLAFAAGGFLTVYRLQRYLVAPTRKNLVLTLTAFLVAGLSKFSAIPLLVAIMAALLLLKIIIRAQPALKIKKWLPAVLLAIPVVWLTIWAIYGFDIRRPNADPRVHQLYEQRDNFLATRDITETPWLEQLAIKHLGDKQSPLGSWLVRASDWPIPNYAWLRGWTTVIGHSIGGQESYLLGEFREFGWWYYFPLAILVKTPLPTLLGMLGVSVIIMIAIRRTIASGAGIGQLIGRHPAWFLYVTVPLIFFGLSLTSHLNLGWRYVMFIYPFVFVLAGALAAPSVIANRRLRIVAPLLLGIGMVLIQIRTYPNELGYFNTLAGGSDQGYKYLLDSNIDWGQDLPKLEKFMKQNNLTTIPFAYYGRQPAAAYLSPTRLPTSSDIRNGTSVHGYIAISLGELIRQDGLYEWLRSHKPLAVLGSSIYVYQFP